MKKYIIQSILLSGLMIGFCAGLQAQVVKSRADSVESARLAERAVVFAARMAKEKVELEQRAKALNIPLKYQIGKKTYTLREITPSGEPVYDGAYNLTSIRSSSANHVKAGGSLGLGLTGAGQTLGIWEAEEDGNTAVRSTHDEFGGRVTVIDGGAASDHATHVAGTMIGSGFDDDAEGFSTGADLLSFSIGADVIEMDAAAQAPNFIRISNHSYGSVSGWNYNDVTDDWDWMAGGAAEDWEFGAYNGTARNWDEVSFNNPFLTIFKAAGNDRGDGPGTVNPTGALRDGGLLGYDCIPTYGTAKNVVTVGAVNDVAGGYAGPGSVTMSTFSGWGPTDDGRIKPDIVANGVGLYSSIGTGDSDYDSYSGTSMATPSAAGGSGLLLEHWNNVLGGVPRSSTLKGLLIESADECGGANGPDYSFGWGMMNVADAAQLITIEGYTGCQQYVEGSVGNGDVFTHTIYSDGNNPIKVTLTWTDVESGTVNGGTLNPAGANYLVNNLDLRLDSDGGTTFFPWVLNPANPAAAATTGDNDRDNVEQVLVLNPAAGAYTIRVVAPATVTDGPQRFTLWFTGNGAADEDITVSGVTINNNRTFAARRNIVFGPAVTINAPANVRAYAGKSVRLQPGFRATAGSTFLAKILPGGGCGIWTSDLKSDNYAGSKAVIADNGERLQLNPQFVENDRLTLDISPNPASEIVSARWALDNPLAPVTLRVLNQQGVEVSRQSFKTATVQSQVLLQNFAPGAYTLVVDNGLQRVAKQFVVAAR